MLLSDVCLSVAYIGPKSRTERHRKTKIGTEVAFFTRDSDTTFLVKRSRSPGRFTHRRVDAPGGCSGGRGNVLAARNCCYVAVCSAARGASAPLGRRGVGHTVAAARLQVVCCGHGIYRRMYVQAGCRTSVSGSRSRRTVSQTRSSE